MNLNIPLKVTDPSMSSFNIRHLVFENLAVPALILFAERARKLQSSHNDTEYTVKTNDK